MAIALYTQPVFTLDCDRCDYAADLEESEVTLFGSETEAREWAADNGWDTHPRKDSETVLCPGCKADDEDQAEQDAEIAAAVRYAVDNT